MEVFLISTNFQRMLQYIFFYGIRYRRMRKELICQLNRIFAQRVKEKKPALLKVYGIWGKTFLLTDGIIFQRTPWDQNEG